MKLVRDYIPQIIHEDNRDCQWYKIETKDQHVAFLKEKMAEELDEFIADPCEDEAADMFEVFLALLKINDISFEDVVDASYVKKLERGGFEEGIVLTKVV